MYHPSVCFSFFSPSWMVVSCSCVCYFTLCFTIFLYILQILFFLVSSFSKCFWTYSLIWVLFLICRFFHPRGCLSLLFSFCFLFSLPLTPFLIKKKSFANRSSLFSCLFVQKQMTSNYWFFFLFLFSIINFSFFFITCFFLFQMFFAKKKTKNREKRFFLLLLFWKFPQEMFLPLSTWLNCLVKKRFPPSANFFFILSFSIFLWEWRFLLLPFVLLSHFDFLLFFSSSSFHWKKNLIAYLLCFFVFFFAFFHLFVSFFLFHFVLFVFLSFLLFLFFEHMFFLFHFPSGSNCFVSSLSFLFFFVSFRISSFVFSTFSNQKPFVL